MGTGGMDFARSCLIARSQVSALLETCVSVAGSRNTPPVLRAALWHPMQYCLTVAAAAAPEVCAFGWGVCARPVEVSRVARIVPAINHLGLDFELNFAGIRPLIIIQGYNAGSTPQADAQAPCLHCLARVK